MNKRIVKYTMILLTAVAFLSCEKAERYAPKVAASGNIQFQVADAYVPAAQVGLVQPTYDLISARFSKATTTSAQYAGGNAVITVNLSSIFTNLTINYLTTNSAGIVREQKATFSGISGSVTWTQSIAGLTFAGSPVATSAAGTTHNLEFIASNADGTIKNTRVFQLVLLN